MNRSRLRTSPTLARRSAVGLVVATLVLANATAASAHEQGEERPPDASAGEAQLLAAIERDLGLNEEQAEAIMTASAEAIELDARLRDELGDAYAGSWLQQRTGVLVVAVTDQQSARIVRESGARAKLVHRGTRQLETIMTDVSVAARAGNDDLQEWYVDPATSQVVVTVQEGDRDAAADLLATHGKAIRVETVTGVVQPSDHDDSSAWLDAGIAYESCSTGFNMRNPNNGDRYFLTAGHCHLLPGRVPKGGTVSSHGRTVGTVTDAFWGPADDGLIQVTNTFGWSQGAWVWTYDHFAFGAALPVSGWSDPPVGTTVCKSGRTTQLTCGTIQARGVTQTQTAADGTTATVTNLVRHNACAGRGDSGGPTFFPNFSDGTWSATAVAITSSSNLQCLSGQSQTQQTTSYPLSITLPFFEFRYGVVLWER